MNKFYELESAGDYNFEQKEQNVESISKMSFYQKRKYRPSMIINGMEDVLKRAPVNSSNRSIHSYKKKPSRRREGPGFDTANSVITDDNRSLYSQYSDLSNLSEMAKLPPVDILANLDISDDHPMNDRELHMTRTRRKH